jgi:hypothetical protein
MGSRGPGRRDRGSSACLGALANGDCLAGDILQVESEVSLTAYRILCLRFAYLVRFSLGFATDTRLDNGWVASSYPTETLTREAPPSFSWRENAAVQRAGAKRPLRCNGSLGGQFLISKEFQA